MYKKITHTIVEEHFDHPMATQIAKEVNKSSWKEPLRYYSDGTQISSNLPYSYRISASEQRCDSCLKFNPATNICSQWSALVRPEYVCDSWTAI
jgi:hypothetical protein